MAANSPIAAAQELYGTLTAANFPGATRPGIYFDQAPQYDGQQVQPGTGYVVMKDGGFNSELTFEDDTQEAGSITLEVYADTLANVDAVVKAIRWNGQTPRTRSGFDNGTLSYNSPLFHHELVHVSEVRRVAGVGKSGQRVHMAEVVYKIVSRVGGASTP